jgi:uncharacterized protein (TIGR03792 family)
MLQETICPSGGEAVEILRFMVNPENVTRFVELDHDIWTKGLAAYPGFISKDVWLNTLKPGEITTVIYWRSLEQWEAIDHAELGTLDTCFEEALDGISFSTEALHEGNGYMRIRNTTLTN